MKKYIERFEFENGETYVHLSGKFPNKLLRDKKNVFQPLIDACISHQCNKALIDATDLDVGLNTMELFKAGEDAAHMSRLNLRVAIVAREDMFDQFFEDVAVNRGGDIEVFTDMDAAREWLKGSR